MSAVEQAVVLVGALWLAVLTIVLMLVVRQTSLLTVSLGITEGRFSNVLDNDGPEVGFDIKPLLSRLDGTGGMSSVVPEASTLLLMSATCQPCREVAGAMNTAGLPSDVQPLVLLTGGGRPADELESLIAGASRAIVRDPQATQIAEGLSIVSTPFALSISNGLVRAKSYVRTLDDLQELSSLASEQSEEERAVSEEVAS